MKLVSVIIPLYNKEKWISRCIDSVIKQTYENLEILVINDGSTDKSEEVVRAFSDKRIRLFSRENHGRSAARNFGLQKANGEFVLFLDADDEITPDHAKTLVNGFQIDPEVVAVADCLVETLKGMQQEAARPFDEKEYIEKEGKKYILLDQYIKTFADRYFLLSTSSTMVRRNKVDKSELVFLESAEPAEDVNLWIRLSRVGKIAYSDFVGAFYHRDDSESVMMGEQGKTQFVPPFIMATTRDQYSASELSELRKFLRWEYFKKAYQNRGKKFDPRELKTKFQFINIGRMNRFIYVAIRYIPWVFIKPFTRNG